MFSSGKSDEIKRIKAYMTKQHPVAPDISGAGGGGGF